MIQKLKKNDKGFTLVELIVVIAILGVLMAVLVPQYIQYVEKSRIGVDESLIGEVSHVMELAYAVNSDITTYNSGTTTITVTVADGAIAVATPTAVTSATVNAAMAKELSLTFPSATDNFKSKAYGAQTITITMTAGKTAWTKVVQS